MILRSGVRGFTILANTMLKTLLIIGLGGSLGSMARYLAQFIAAKTWIGPFPHGTFIVNVVGSLLIGIVYGLSDRSNWISPEWRIFMATGFCGGFTTFSTFSYENLALLRDGNYPIFGLYATLSFISGIGATLLGLMITK